MVKNIAYLGPALSFCEEAAMTYSGTPQEQMLACAAISEVFAAVDEGKALQGIVPIENSCEGSVNETLDLLAYDYFLAVTGETIIPVEHHALMRKEMQAAEPTRILSHPQALAQCRRNLKKLFPYVQLSAVSSTAEAARMVAASDQPWAALASAGAACAYGLLMVQKNMHDHPNNETRFVVIGKKHNDYKPGCKTSLLIHTQHAPGALYQCLHEFAQRGINLNRIESRPARTSIGEYMFFIDIDGHAKASPVKQAVKALSKVAKGVRILGSYPVAIRTK